MQWSSVTKTRQLSRLTLCVLENDHTRMLLKERVLHVGEIRVVGRGVEVAVDPPNAVKGVVGRHGHHGAAPVGQLDDGVVGSKLAEFFFGDSDVVVCCDS